jgi:hypothetical protein
MVYDEVADIGWKIATAPDESTGLARGDCEAGAVRPGAVLRPEPMVQSHAFASLIGWIDDRGRGLACLRLRTGSPSALKGFGSIDQRKSGSLRGAGYSSKHAAQMRRAVSP